MNKFLIFSHGYGVDKNSMGLFSTIAENNKNFKSTLFDYYTYDGNDIIIPSLHAQAKILQSKLDLLEGEITLVCHSQGCSVAALLLSQIPINKNIKKVILLAPAGNINPSNIEPLLSSLDGEYYNRQKKEGTVLKMSKGYLTDVINTDSMKLYSKLVKNYDVEIILAAQDEMVRFFDKSKLPLAAKITTLDGDHNFTGDNRAGIVKAVSSLLPV